MKIQNTLHFYAPKALVAKVRSKGLSFYSELKEAYEDPTFVLVEYNDGTKIPAPLFLELKQMMKMSRRVDMRTISSWIKIKMKDHGRGRKLVQDYVKKHITWKEQHVQS